MTITTVTFSDPDVAVVVETTNGEAIVSNTRNSEVHVATSRYSSHDTYLNLEDALSAALSIDADFDGKQLFGGFAFTEVNVSDSELDFEIGTSATINCEYSVDAGNLTYQWYKNGSLIQGATSSSINTNSFSNDQVGFYTCEITATDTTTARTDIESRNFDVTETKVLTSATAIGA